MPDSSSITADELEANAASLLGSTIVAVRYFGIDSDHGSPWDFATWHQATMGIELKTDDHIPHSVTWGDAFGHFGIELRPLPMHTQIYALGDAGGPFARDVTEHPSWSLFIGHPLVAVEVLWRDDTLAEGNAPVAIRLQTAEAELWLVVGAAQSWPPGDDFYLGMDELMVVFDRAFADRLGVTGP